MPFACAKAVMATFCYEIRHLLTPVFGKDFMQTCLLPTDNGFGSFKIDPAIVQACTEDMRSWRALYAHDTPPRSHPGSPQSLHSPSATYTSTSAPSTPLLHKSLLSRTNKRKHNPFSGETESGYGTDPERDFASSSAYTSPQVSPKTVLMGSEWTSINQIKRSTRFDSPTSGLMIDPTPAMPKPRKIARAKRAVDIDEFMGETDGSDDDLRRPPPAKARKQAEKHDKSIKLKAREWQVAAILHGMRNMGQQTPSPSQSSVPSPTLAQDPMPAPTSPAPDADRTPVAKAADAMEGLAIDLPARSSNYDDNKSKKRTAAEAFSLEESSREKPARLRRNSY